MTLPEALVEAAYAVGIGLAVGFEREHHDLTRGLAPEEVPGQARPQAMGEPAAAGARTFAILALAGWLAAWLGDLHAAITPVGVIALVGLLITQYVLAVRAGTAQLGITTEVSAVVVVFLGMLVHHDRTIAVPIALALILLLVAKPWTRGAAVRLRRIEVTATVQLLVLAAIVLPLLPAEPVDPWDAIPPRKVGIFIVAIAGVEYVGYVLHRTLGAQRGIGITGLVGGLVSSTAVTAAMARRARQAESMVGPGQQAVLLANAVMAVRVAVISVVLAPAVAGRVAPVMGAMVVVLVGAALLRRGGGTGPVDEEAIALRNPFALLPALSWGAILCAVLLAAHLAMAYFGGRGLLVAATLSGLADVDAITLAAARAVARGAQPVEIGALAIVIAVAANTVLKGGIARVAGGKRFGTGILVAFAIALAAAALTVGIGLAISR
jgi:uncharacterized membrane protein (DUF4010 family)